jgi:hypothetical protein
VSSQNADGRPAKDARRKPDTYTYTDRQIGDPDAEGGGPTPNETF